MLPQGLTIKTKDDMIIWKNTTGNITEEEALNVSLQITNLIKDHKFHTMIVDNRDLNGVWTTEVDRVWIELMQELPTYVDKTVTICQNVINKLQLNYLSKQAGTDTTIRAFVSNEAIEIKTFLGVDSYPNE